jgi:hypothetical protein
MSMNQRHPLEIFVFDCIGRQKGAISVPELLVAAMNVHGVGRILTFNVDDFARYGIEVLHPSSVSA